MKKAILKSLSIILSLAVIIAVFPLVGVDLFTTTTAKTISEYAVGDIIEFGSYPQSEVTDSKTLSKLNSLSLNWVSYGYYSGTGNWFDGEMQPSDYMKYADVTYKSVKYRAVTFSQYRPGQTGGLTNADSSCQDENGYLMNNVYWFIYEPIKWKVLDPTQGLIMSEIILDAQAYNNTVYYDGRAGYYSSKSCLFSANNYEMSSINGWLNYDFINIALTHDDYRVLNGDVFLISSEEARNKEYGFNPQRYDSTLQAKYSDYSVCQGLPSASNGYATWYFRSKGQAACHATFVNEHGYIYGYNNVNNILGIRPLMKISIDLEIPKQNVSTTHKNYYILDREFENNLDYYAENLNSSTYNPVLANMMAALSKAIYSEEKIARATRSLGFTEHKTYDYYGACNPNTCGYSLSFKKSDYGDEIICLVSVRGTQSLDYSADWFGNINIVTDIDGHHLGFQNPANRIFDNIEKYIESNNITKKVKFFITGHSRGGAVGNLLSVKLMSIGVDASNIYNYNFACPNVACKINVSNYTNIFNLCNREDVVPLIPNVLSPIPGASWTKYGQTYWFTKDTEATINPFSDHAMDLYLEFFDQQLNPTDWGYSFWDKMDDAVGWTIGWVVKILCPVDVIITDEMGTKVASVINGEINYYDSNFGEIIILTDGDKKAVYIEGDRDFSIELIGTDYGTMTYTLEHCNLASGEIYESKTFNDVALEDGKTMYSPASEAEETDDVQLFVTEEKDGEKVYTHIINEDGTEDKYYIFSIQEPSRTEIRNKDGIILHAVVDGTAPDGSYVRWESSNGNFDKDADGNNLEIIAKNKGYTTFTAILCDADGNELARDSVEMYSKSGFFDKIGGFFRSLFGATKVYEY